MKIEKGKIFNAQEVQAIIAGNKTMFREVVSADITQEKVDIRWYLSQHMKQKQSRITLKIKSVKVERLQDISESDVMKEGCYLTEDDMGQPIFGFCKEEVDQELGYRKAQNAYKIYWNSNHKKQEQKWEANPWVWVVDFKINK